MNSRIYGAYKNGQSSFIEDDSQVEPVDNYDTLLEEIRMGNIERLKEIATPSAMEVITRWTEGLGVCTYDFLPILDQADIDMDDIKSLSYNEGHETLTCETYSEVKCDIELEKVLKNNSVGFFIIHVSDPFRENQTTEYQYRIKVSAQELNVELYTIKIRTPDGLTRINLPNGIFDFDNQGVHYNVHFNCREVLDFPVLCDEFVAEMINTTITSPTKLYKTFCDEFDITPEIAENMKITSITITDSVGRHVANYHRGVLQEIVEPLDGGVYSIRRDGTWKYSSALITITKTGVLDLWFDRNKLGNSYHEYEAMAKETVERLQAEFFN